MSISLQIGNIQLGDGHDLLLIAGPCVLESPDTVMKTARFLKELGERCRIQVVFKASYDKANRTSIHAYRGPGMTEGLKLLREVRQETGLPLLSDVHRPEEIPKASEILDIIQIPAFLCRQTDLIVAAAKSGKPLNIKKGQFLAPWDMKNVIEKITDAGNDRIMITERGTSFGYNNLVVDFRSIPILRGLGVPVIFDATHSVQLPGGGGTHSQGQRQFAPALAAAAVAAGADGVFMEIHPDPDRALCDGPNSLSLDHVPDLVENLIRIRAAVGGRGQARGEKGGP